MKRIEKQDWILLSLFILIGAILRIYQIDRLPLWFDEAASFFKALMPIPEIIKLSYTWDYSPASFYLIQHFMLKLGQSEVHVRLFSLVMSLVSIPVFYRMLKEQFDKRVRVVAMILFVLSAYQVRYAQEGRVFMVFFLTSLLATIYFHRLIEHGRKRDWLCWTGWQVAGLYLHYFAPILICAHLATWMIERLKNRSAPKRFYDIRWMWLGFLIMFIGFLPQLYFFILQAMGKMDAGNSLWIVKNPVIFLLIFIKRMISPVDLANPIIDQVLKYVILLALSGGLVMAWNKYHRPIWINLSVLGFALLFSWFSTFVLYFSGTFRYVIFLLIPFILLVAISLCGWADGLNFLIRKAKRSVSYNQKASFVCLIIPLILMIAVQGYCLQQLYTQPVTANWPEAARVVQSRTTPDNLLVTAPEWADYMLRYYFKREPGSSPRVIRILNMSTSDLDSLSQAHNPFWVLKTDHMASKDLSREFDDWLVRHGELVWRDEHFSQYGIWEIP